jgi:hypothetical protein
VAPRALVGNGGGGLPAGATRLGKVMLPKPSMMLMSMSSQRMGAYGSRFFPVTKSDKWGLHHSGSVRAPWSQLHGISSSVGADGRVYDMGPEAAYLGVLCMAL